MGKNTSISLSERHQKYLQSKVDSGEFASVSEVVRDALRRAEEWDLQNKRILDAIDQGLASPNDDSFNIRDWIDDKIW